VSSFDKRLSLLLPTRQRRSNLLRLAESIVNTATDPDSIELVVYVDDDDASYDDLLLPMDWTRVEGPRVHDDGLVNLSAKWNQCFARCYGDIIMHCGDDIVMRTPGWDDIVYEAFDATPDKILFAGGRDGIQDDNDLITHGFLHRRWVETVGYFLPPCFSSDYNDRFLTDVANFVDRRVDIPIYTEHMHFCANKAQIDQNTAERLERHQRDRPDLLYESDLIQGMIKEAAGKLRGVMNAT
jgi:glycosyltransferase involved in cell wall biosynthesis